MRQLAKYEVLRSDGQRIYIKHQVHGEWWDISDGVFVLLDIIQLYLQRSGLVLDCDEYEETWTAYCEDADEVAHKK